MLIWCSYIGSVVCLESQLTFSASWVYLFGESTPIAVVIAAVSWSDQGLVWGAFLWLLWMSIDRHLVFLFFSAHWTLSTPSWHQSLVWMRYSSPATPALLVPAGVEWIWVTSGLCVGLLWLLIMWICQPLPRLPWLMLDHYEFILKDFFMDWTFSMWLKHGLVLLSPRFSENFYLTIAILTPHQCQAKKEE